MPSCPDKLRCIFDGYDPMTDTSYCVNCGEDYDTAVRKQEERESIRDSQEELKKSRTDDLKQDES